MTIQSAFPQFSFWQDLQQLLNVEFLQEVFFELLEPGKPYARLLVVNHQDQYLGLSNENYYIAVLTDISPACLAEIQEELGYIQQRKKIVIRLQQLTDLTAIASYRRIFLTQLRQQAEKNGVSKENLYLRLLEQLFEEKTTLERQHQEEKNKNKD